MVSALILPAFGLSLFLLPQAIAQCSREALLSTADAYLTAQINGNISSLKVVASNFTYMENNKKVDIAKGLLGQPLIIDLSRSTADTEACASYTMFISSTGSKPYVVGTQIRHGNSNSTTVGGNGTASSATITLIDSIVATTGDLFFDAKQTLAYIRQEDWTTISDASRRPSRAALKAAGDAYLDMWTDAGAADRIPWGSDCERVEGSRLTRPCGATLPRGGSAKRNGDRRYVVDETVGSVDVLCSFDSLGNMPDSHEIRIVDGKVKYVHTITDIE